jgi:hypothetical protein
LEVGGGADENRPDEAKAGGSRVEVGNAVWPALRRSLIDPAQNEFIVHSHPFRTKRGKEGAPSRSAFVPDQ